MTAEDPSKADVTVHKRTKMVRGEERFFMLFGFEEERCDSQIEL